MKLFSKKLTLVFGGIFILYLTLSYQIGVNTKLFKQRFFNSMIDKLAENEEYRKILKRKSGELQIQNGTEVEAKADLQPSTKLDINGTFLKKGSPPYLFWVQIARMGNFLCQYAGTYCLALKSGKTHTIEKSNEYLDYFPKLRSSSHFQDYFNYHNKENFKTNRTLSFLNVNYNLKFHPHILQYALNHSGNVAVFFWFECWQYYLGCEREIKNVLEFEPKIQADVNEIISNFTKGYIQRNNITQNEIQSIRYISVHIRRTDRLRNAPPAMFFIKAMNAFKEMYKHPLFFVTTDDLSWWKAVISNYSLTTDNIYTSTNTKNYIQDFALLASCNNSIISAGTYGWFAAWLHGGSTMIYGNRWINTPPYLKECFKMPHWIEIFV